MIGATRQVSVHAFAARADKRNRRRARVLYWDGTGLCVFAKRLERGRLAAPWECGNGAGLRLTVSEFALLLEGSELVEKMSLSKPPFVFTAR